MGVSGRMRQDRNRPVGGVTVLNQLMGVRHRPYCPMPHPHAQAVVKVCDSHDLTSLEAGLKRLLLG